MRLHYDREAPLEDVRRALAAPIAERQRDALEHRLAKLGGV
jgi:hypothetical protein